MSEAVRIDLESGSLDGLDGGQLDDLAIRGEAIELLHLERMDDGYFWGRIDLTNGRSLVLGFVAEKKRKLGAKIEWDDPV